MIELLNTQFLPLWLNVLFYKGKEGLLSKLDSSFDRRIRALLY